MPLLMLHLLACAHTALGPSVSTSDVVVSGQAMGGPTRVVLRCAETAEQCTAQALAALAEVERLAELYGEATPTQALHRLNAAAGGELDTPLPTETQVLLEEALWVSRETGGRYDPLAGGLLRLWDFEQGLLPDPQRLSAALQAIDGSALILGPGGARLRSVDLQVSLSALAPTEAAEKALAVIPSDREAFVEVAGDVAVRGSWTVGLAHPRKPRGQAMAAVQLRDAMLSVVSDQEGSFDRDGTRYHPTLDPDSGQPGRGAICAAVVHPDGAMAAGLARALMVVGPDDKLVRRLGGWAMVVDPRGAVHQLGSAPGMVPRVELLSAVVP